MAGNHSNSTRPLVTESAAMKAVLASIEKISRDESEKEPTPVVIEGEPGSGRGFVAEYLHLMSSRAHRAMVSIEAKFSVNESADFALADTETTQVRRAQGGTLLVRDVGSLRRSGQKKLTKALHENRESNIRVLVTAEPGLRKAMKAGMFYEPLLHFLTRDSIVVPPLRDRQEDIMPLMFRFISALCRDTGRGRLGVSCRATDRLQCYPWPGNVSELKQIARLLIASVKGTLIEVGDVDAVLPTLARRVPAEDASFEDLVQVKLKDLMRQVQGYPVNSLHEEVMSLVERPLLVAVMEHTGNNQLKAAKILGLSRNTLRRKLSGYGLTVTRTQVSSTKARLSNVGRNRS